MFASFPYLFNLWSRILSRTCIFFPGWVFFFFFVINNTLKEIGGTEILQVTASNFCYEISRTKSLHSQLLCTVVTFSTIFVIQYNILLMLHNIFKYENTYWDDRWVFHNFHPWTNDSLFASTQGIITVPEKLVWFVTSQVYQDLPIFCYFQYKRKQKMH